MSLRPHFAYALALLLCSATPWSWGGYLPCPEALVPEALVSAQYERSPQPMIERFLEGLGVDFTLEQPFNNGWRLFFTPVSSPVLNFMEGRPQSAVIVRGDVDGRRVPLLFITGNNRRYPTKEIHGNTISLTDHYPEGHPLREMGIAVYDALRQVQYKYAAGLAATGLPFLRVGEGYYSERLKQRYDSAWTVRSVNSRGATTPATGTVWQFPTVFFAPERGYSSELLGQVIPHTRPDHRVLVLGTGTGIDVLRIITQAGVTGTIEAVDINPMAVANTRFNAEYWNIGPRVHAHVSDGFDSVEGGPFDVIVFDAPLATQFTARPNGTKEEDIDPSLNDFEGRLLRRLLTGLPFRLAAGGSFYLMSAENISSVIAEFPALKSRRVHRFMDGHHKHSHPFGIHRIQVRKNLRR